MKKAFFKIILIFLTLNAQGQKSQPDVPFERLFTTEIERKSLNQNRYDYFGDILPINIEKNKIKTEPRTEIEQNNNVTLSGIAIRPDGKHILWIDGKVQYSDYPNNNSYKTRLVNNNLTKIRISTGEKRKTLKPGQVWSLTDNKVIENYEFQKIQKEKTASNSLNNLSVSSELLKEKLVNKKSASTLSQAKETLKTMKKLKESTAKTTN